MAITYSAHRSDISVNVSLDGDTITAVVDGQAEVFDFSGFGDGEATAITSSLDPCPVLSARRVDGVLHVELLRAVPPRPQTDDERELDAWRALWTTEQLPSDLAHIVTDGTTPHAAIEWRPQAEIDAERDAQAWASVRAERDRRIDSVEWMRRRHLDEQDLGLSTTLTAEQYNALLGYIQDLRDVPQDNEDASNINWPLMPEFVLQ